MCPGSRSQTIRPKTKRWLSSTTFATSARRTTQFVPSSPRVPRCTFPLTPCFPPWQFLGMLHVVALAHALNRTVIMMDAGPQMTCGAYGYQAVRAVAASLLALRGLTTAPWLCATRTGARSLLSATSRQTTVRCWLRSRALLGLWAPLTGRWLGCLQSSTHFGRRDLVRP